MTEALQYSGDELMAMMHADGPVVKCVIVAADGTAAEVELDMTPKKEAVKEALGGAVTFLGQWEPLGVFLLVRREDGGLPKFAGRLPKPFDAATGVFGGACLMLLLQPSFGVVLPAALALRRLALHRLAIAAITPAISASFSCARGAREPSSSSSRPPPSTSRSCCRAGSASTSRPRRRTRWGTSSSSPIKSFKSTASNDYKTLSRTETVRGQDMDMSSRHNSAQRGWS